MGRGINWFAGQGGQPRFRMCLTFRPRVAYPCHESYAVPCDRNTLINTGTVQTVAGKDGGKEKLVVWHLANSFCFDPIFDRLWQGLGGVSHEPSPNQPRPALVRVHLEILSLRILFPRFLLWQHPKLGTWRRVERTVAPLKCVTCFANFPPYALLPPYHPSEQFSDDFTRIPHRQDLQLENETGWDAFFRNLCFGDRNAAKIPAQ